MLEIVKVFGEESLKYKVALYYTSQISTDIVRISVQGS